MSSVEPKLRRLVELQMVEASSHISNFTSLFIRPNEQLNVTCTIESAQQTDFVYWYKNKEPILFDNLKSRSHKQDAKQTTATTTTTTITSTHEAHTLLRTHRDASYTMPSVYDATRLRSYTLHEVNGNYKNEEQDDDDDNNNNDDQEETTTRRTKEQASEKMNKKKIKSTKKMRTKQGYQQEQQHHAPDVKLVKSSSSLVIAKSQLNDTANYTCLVSYTVAWQEFFLPQKWSVKCM